MRRIFGFRIEPFHAAWFDHQAASRFSLVLAPRGHGKSTILNVGYTLWRILKNPDERVLVVSATGLQAQGFVREMKAQLENNRRITGLFGRLAGPRWNEREIILAGRTRMAKESTVTALGVEGGIISRHYDTIILDDVVDERSVRTRATRDRIAEWFYKVLMPCLEPGGRLHLLGTRYHPDDLYGRLISRTENVRFLN